MALTTYNCTALTGGAARALDSYSVGDLVDGDRAICAVDEGFLYFMFDSTATDAENVSVHPYTVRPDDYDTEGVWIEQEIRARLDYVKVSDVKAYNVAGGTFTQDGWRTRDINTEDNDSSNICSISSNQITLEPGTYRCHIRCSAYGVSAHTARLYNISDSEVTMLGNIEYAPIAYTEQSDSKIIGEFTIATQKTFEIQHYCKNTCSTNGFGTYMGVSGTDTIFTVAQFWRVAT